MNNETEVSQTSQQQRLTALLQKLLPIVDGVAGWFRLIFIIGLVAVLWIGYWMINIQHLSWLLSLSLSGISLIPLFLVGYFWWSLEELKNLPTIAGAMLSGVKAGLMDKAKNIHVTKIPKLGVFGATKGLWSIGSLLMDAQEIVGSYLSITTLLNPLMLGLVMLAIACVFVLVLVAVVLMIMAL